MAGVGLSVETYLLPLLVWSGAFQTPVCIGVTRDLVKTQILIWYVWVGPEDLRV